MVLSEGLLFFCDGCGDGSIRCNGRSKLLPYEKYYVIVQMQNHTSTHRPSPYEKYYVIVQMQNHTSTHRPSPYEKLCTKLYILSG